jgi:hypothetical protein
LATILFADEASVRTDYHAGTTWAAVGQTPVVTGSAVRHAVKMVSAIGQRGELSFQVHEGSMNAERFIEFLKSLIHDFDTPIFLVVDGSSVHRRTSSRSTSPATQGRLELAPISFTERASPMPRDRRPGALHSVRVRAPGYWLPLHGLPGAGDHRGDVLHGVRLEPGQPYQGPAFGVGDCDTV